jgi:lysophospholipase L1-like esterase
MSGHRLTPRRLRVIVLLGGTLLSLLLVGGLGEVYLRLNRPPASPQILRRQSLEYEATLFARHALPRMRQDKIYEGRIPFHVNERGYRGRPFAVPKPPGTVRLVVLGGSAAFDTEAPEGRDWPRQVETLLRRRGHPEVEVINAGTPGHATWDALGRLYAEIWMFEPDYVLVYESWNDIKSFRGLGPGESLLRHFQPADSVRESGTALVDNPFLYPTGPVDRLLCHSQLYVRLRSRYWSWRLGIVGFEGALRPRGADAAPEPADRYSPVGPRQVEMNLRLIAAAARAAGARPVFLTQARRVWPSNTPEERATIRYEHAGLTHEALLRAFADCDRAMRAAGAAEGAPVLDLAAAAQGHGDWFVDHVHTTAKGSAEIARRTADFLEPLLRMSQETRGGGSSPLGGGGLEQGGGTHPPRARNKT